MMHVLVPVASLILFAVPAAAQEAVIDIPPKPAKPAPARPRPAPAKAMPAKPAPAKVKPAANPAAARDKPAAKPAGKPAAKSAKPARLTDRATGGSFGILQVSAPDASRFIADWRAGTASRATSVRTVADKPLFVFIIFHGCKADADGACDVTADFAIRRPDGSIDDDHKDMAIWKRNAPGDPAKLVLGDGALGFGTDAEGPFGDYRITATVTDRVAGITLKTEQVLTVAPAAASADAPAAPAETPKVESPQL